MKHLLTILAAFLALAAAATGWETDIDLGTPFQMRYVDQGRDYSGSVRSTIVRLESPCADSVGVLYVHGFNDYFFQKEMAEQFAAHCYGFYAVDLRKYGRSILPEQRRFEVRDLREYFADIDSAIVQMQHDGIREIVLMGHSTGGLITAYYMSQSPSPAVKALVLNSPFLDWNQSKFQEKFLIPMVGSLGKALPKINIPQGGDTTYGRSLKDFGWNYNPEWKLMHSPDVQSSWIRAIDNAQAVVQNFPHIQVPILLMHSDRTARTGDGTAAHADAVLDVEDISRYGRRLGVDVDEFTVVGGIHDLMLSAPAVRADLYDALFSWLARRLPR